LPAQPRQLRLLTPAVFQSLADHHAADRRRHAEHELPHFRKLAVAERRALPPHAEMDHSEGFRIGDDGHDERFHQPERARGLPVDFARARAAAALRMGIDCLLPERDPRRNRSPWIQRHVDSDMGPRLLVEHHAMGAVAAQQLMRLIHELDAYGVESPALADMEQDVFEQIVDVRRPAELADQLRLLAQQFDRLLQSGKLCRGSAARWYSAIGHDRPRTGVGNTRRIMTKANARKSGLPGLLRIARGPPVLIVPRSPDETQDLLSSTALNMMSASTCGQPCSPIRCRRKC